MKKLSKDLSILSDLAHKRGLFDVSFSLMKLSTIIQGPWDKKPPEQPDLMQLHQDIEDPSDVPNLRVLLHHILWDVDAEEENKDAEQYGYRVQLPDHLIVPVPEKYHPEKSPQAFESYMDKWIDDTYGFAHNGYQWKLLSDDPDDDDDLIPA